MCASWIEHLLAHNLSWSNFGFYHSLTTTVNTSLLFATWKLRNQLQYSNSNRTEFKLDRLLTLRKMFSERTGKSIVIFYFGWHFFHGMHGEWQQEQRVVDTFQFTFRTFSWSGVTFFSSWYSNKWLLHWHSLFAGQSGTLSLVFKEIHQTENID